MTETLFFNEKMTDYEIISSCLRCIKYSKIPSSGTKVNKIVQKKKKLQNTIIKQG